MWLLLISFVVCSSQQSSYSVSSIQSSPSIISALLTYQGPVSPPIISPLNLTLIAETESRLRIRITDPNASRFEVPNVTLPLSFYSTFAACQYSVSLSSPIFNLTVVRKSNNQTIFSIVPGQTFQYHDQDIILTTALNYKFYVYGIGERVSNFPLNPGTYTLFSRGLPGPYDDGKPPGKNMYSSQPVFIGLDGTGNAHGGFLLNSNAMDVYISAQSVTFRPIGGIIDYFVFVGPTAEAVVQQYHALVGKPVLIPYWTLGYHQSRWGYHNLSTLEAVAANFTKYQIPLDVLWTDIDYMTNFEDFTLDPARYNYSQFAAFLQTLHSNNRKFVPIVDAAVARTDYPPYNIGLDQNVFIGSPHHSGPLVGKVWPGPAVFIDWLNPNTTSYWHSMLSTLNQLIDFDGLWLDMNDPQNFCDGECGYPASQFVKTLPFMPGEVSLNFDTIDLAATHYGGFIENDLHNMYAFYMAQASSSYLSSVLNKRPFILSRGSFPGHGRFASKWLGDNYSLYDWMRYSIPGVFNFHIFGIPLIGADICGFSLDTTEELCCRWYQLGTLYPFTRNHNSNDSISQEPWALGPTLLSVSNSAIRNKYSLINFFYSHMFMLSLEGGTFFRPSFFNYPGDVSLQYTHAQEQFMLGNELLVHPVLKDGVSVLEAYFPADIWYNWYTGRRVITTANRTTFLDAPVNGTINIHIRGGTVITRNDGFETAMTVEELRFANLTFVVALDGEGNAKGFLVIDDGESLDTIEKKNFTAVQYEYIDDEAGAFLQFAKWSDGYKKKEGEWPFVSKIVIYGIDQGIASVYRGQERVDYYCNYDARTKVASVGLMNIEPDVEQNLQINYQLHNVVS
jgi:alpha-glucosidase (family GH31 glycosyl hydrolase)